MLLTSHLILGLFEETEQCLCSANRQIKLKIPVSAWPISAPNKNLFCKAFRTAPAWQDSSSPCDGRPAEGLRALPCDGSKGLVQLRCQAQMCHVPAVRWSWKKGQRLSREQLLLPAGNGSAFHTPTLLLMPSPSPSQNKWPAMGQRILSGDRVWKGGAELAALELVWCQLVGAVGNQTNLWLWNGTSCFLLPLGRARVGQCSETWLCRAVTATGSSSWEDSDTAAASRAAGVRAKLLVSGRHKHMVHVASTSGAGGESPEGYGCDGPDVLPVGFSCQGQRRRSSGITVVQLCSPVVPQTRWQ